jgi:hypothetical protein
VAYVACSLIEHIAADKAQIKGEKEDTVQMSWSASLALNKPGASIFMHKFLI